jgi:hypothetical protein
MNYNFSQEFKLAQRLFLEATSDDLYVDPWGFLGRMTTADLDEMEQRQPDQKLSDITLSHTMRLEVINRSKASELEKAKLLRHASLGFAEALRQLAEKHGVKDA